MAIEVNQKKVTQGNVTVGDAPGFPLTISKSGSYILTSNLIVPDGMAAIQIRASHVTIDLGGFSIIGNSSPAGPSSGLVEGPVNCAGISVKNGHMTGAGVTLAGSNCRVEDIDLSGFYAVIVVGDSGMIRSSILRGDVGYLDSGNGSVIRDNLVSGGDQNAVRVRGGCTVSGNVVFGGGATAIQAGDGCLVIGNSVTGGGEGINVGLGSTVSGNSVQNTNLAGIAYLGSVVVSNNSVAHCGQGIKAVGVPGDGALITGNSVTNCKDLGLDMSSNTGYSNNVLTGNNGGNANPQRSGGVQVGANLCGSSICA